MKAWIARSWFVVPIGAMQYFVAGWIVSRLFPQRRRFAMVAAVTLLFVLSGVLESALIISFAHLLPPLARASTWTLLTDAATSILLPLTTLAGAMTPPLRHNTP